MRPQEALGRGARDLYANSWRLVPLNAAVGLVLVGAVAAALSVRAAAVLLVLAGPLAAALVHCAVTLQRTGDVALADAWAGLRLHWRRGLALGALAAAVGGLGSLALRVYGGWAAWPLVFATLYVLVLLGVYQLLVWTLAIAEPARPLREAAREAARLAARRPGATLGLGLALCLVNAVGLAAAAMPFLTLTIAYSFVAAAHFALPRPTPEEIR